MSAEQRLVYAQRSALTAAPEGWDLLLSTSGPADAPGGAAHPRFFDGVVHHPEQTAAGLLTVARVARTRFYTPPGTLAVALAAADPVVTSNGDRLRFESFSACCGVYARLDLLPDALGEPALGTGTTNVDFHPPMREALARVGAGDPLHLRIGQDVTVSTPGGVVTEKKVPLPDRWVRGFAEAQVAAARMTEAFGVTASQARRFVRSVSLHSSGGSVWVVPGSSGLRLTSRQVPGGVPVSGADRLRVLEPMLRFARGLRVHVDPGRDEAASVWSLDLDGARFVIAISPDRSRGFSGEGGVLGDLADDSVSPDADLVSAVLAFDPAIDVAWIARESGLEPERVRRALTRLGAAGRIGFDAAEGAYFHRELPYDRTAIEGMHPRLRDAHELVEARAVRVSDAQDHIDVLSQGTTYRVRLSADVDRCTCPWFARHRGGRGPCKHVWPPAS